MATNDKYDRQLRLWGASGQRALSSTTVALFGASAAGTETLKNLVLPGVGGIHVVDDAGRESVPSAAESGGAFSDFFVFKDEKKSGGDGEDTRSRAEVACANLLELNPDVKGRHTTAPSLSDPSLDRSALLDDILKESGGSEKLLVVASDLPPPALLPLSRACHAKSIPLVVVRSYGLIGTVRVQVKRHVVIESKPDSSVPDLRLAESKSGLFPQLKALADGYSANLEDLDSKEHGHVPYVIILIKAMERWRAEKGEEGLVFPSTTEEKAAFRQVVRSMARNFNDELNFREAYDDAYLAYATKDVPWEVQELLDNVDSMDTSEDEGNNYGDGKFNVLIRALKKFMDANGGHPPLNGSIPDMTAGTEPYVALQGAYRSKSDEDRKEMRRLVEEVRMEEQSGVKGSAMEISEEELTAFCKNVHNLRKLETRSYADEYEAHSPSPSAQPPSPQEQEIRDELLMATMDPYEVPEHTPLLWHVALRACDAFHDYRGRYPGSDGRALALKSDADEVHSHIEAVAASMGLDQADLIRSHLLDDVDKKHATEMVRYHNAELHNVASVVGGVASQEAVKLITGQYVPLDDTYVYNGIAGVGGVYKL